MEMTESEICRLYRHAKDRGEQVQILAELNRTKRAEIIAILLRNGEKVRLTIPTRGKPRKQEMTDEEYFKALFKHLDFLDEQIAKMENEYRDIVAVIKGAEKCTKTES